MENRKGIAWLRIIFVSVIYLFIYFWVRRKVECLDSDLVFLA